MRFKPVWSSAEVVAVRDLTASIREITLAPALWTPWAPGSHLQVQVMIGEQPDTRSYSLVGAAEPGLYRIAVRRDPASRGGSAYMMRLQPGAHLPISDPQNLFALDWTRPDYLLIAGGIGITPIHAMASALAAHPARLRLAYCGRSRTDMAFLPDLADLLGDRLSLHVSDEGSRLDLAAEFAALPPEAGAYVCGPMRLLDDARAAWAAAGRDPTRLRIETFGSSGQHAPEAFAVRVPRHGLEIVVRDNETLLGALRNAGLDVLSDCERGECGLCALDVLAVEGEVDHRDVFFSEEEKAHGTRICACVSRAVGGALTIDTDYRPPMPHGPQPR